MQCADCLAGQHIRAETAVLPLETATLRWFVCECGECPQPCRTPEVGVEPSYRWYGQHRLGDGAMLSAPAAVWTARAAAARAAAASARAARAANRPGRHRAPELGRVPAPDAGGQGAGELVTCGAGDVPRHDVGVIRRRSTQAASSPARYELDQFLLGRSPVPTDNHQTALSREGILRA
jgi:hypothetical protein